MAGDRDMPGGYAREVRDTVIKSGLTGVAATVFAVAAFSPAGLGGMIGTSVASGLGLDNNTAREDAYANLPAYPSPLTSTELNDIRGQLAQTTASLEITRAATEGKIEYIRSIADASSMGAAPLPPVHVPTIAPTPVVAQEPVAQLAAQEVSTGGGADTTVPYRDPNMELAALLFAHENY
jgi:hypothetical protein